MKNVLGRVQVALTVAGLCRGVPSRTLCRRHSLGRTSVWTVCPQHGNLRLRWLIWERDKSLCPLSFIWGQWFPRIGLGGFSCIWRVRRLRGAAADHYMVLFSFPEPLSLCKRFVGSRSLRFPEQRSLSPLPFPAAPGRSDPTGCLLM